MLDIYNYLNHFGMYDTLTLRDHRKMEGYTMYMDGYVLSLEAGLFQESQNFCFVKTNVKPRTRDVDPITKMKYYQCWIIITSDPSSESYIKSAYCTCKDGMDGGCRHVVATLFEIMEFLNDKNKPSVTSGECFGLVDIF